MEFASTPENRLKYLGEGKKAKSNERYLRLVVEHAEKGNTFYFGDIAKLMKVYLPLRHVHDL